MIIPPLGLALNGGMLQNLPANAGPADMAALLNQIIDKLNSWNGVITRDGIIPVPVSSSAQSLTTVPHGLAYTPFIQAEINNLGIAITGSESLSIPLPAFVGGAGISGGFIQFDAWMFAFADSENIYFYTLNGTGVDQGTFDVTYYLMRLEANQNA